MATAWATPATAVMALATPALLATLTPLELATSPRGRLRLMLTTALTATVDSVLMGTAATAPPPPSEPTSPTATLPLATTGLTLLEPSTLPRGLLILTMATATELDTATDTPAPSPPESPLSLTPDS